MKNKCAIYARLSEEDELKEVSLSIQNQIKNLTEYAKNNDFEIYNYYVDDGVSGKDFNRPAFKNLLKDLQNKKFNILLVKDISRIGRNLIKVGEFVDETLPIFNIRLISILDNYDSKYNTNDESIVLRSFVNEYYLKECRKKALKAIEKVKDIKPIIFIGRYGYDFIDGKLYVNNEQAEIVKRIFYEYLSGKKTSQIRDGLIEDKIYCKGYIKRLKGNFDHYTEEPYNWCTKSILEILHDQTYIGNYVNNEHSNYFEPNILYNTHDAIISKEVYDKVQHMILKNKEKLANTKYAGLFKYKDTLKGLKFRNRGQTFLFTKGLAIPVSLVNEVVSREIDKVFRELTKNPESLIKQLNTEISSYKEQSYNITNKITYINNKIKSTFEDYMNQKISSYEYKSNINNLNIELEKLNIELANLKLLIDASYNEEQYKIVVEEFLKKKEEISDPIALAKIIFKTILISKKQNNEYVFEFKYNI